MARTETGGLKDPPGEGIQPTYIKSAVIFFLSSSSSPSLQESCTRKENDVNPFSILISFNPADQNRSTVSKCFFILKVKHFTGRYEGQVFPIRDFKLSCLQNIMNFKKIIKALNPEDNGGFAINT